LGGSVGWFRSSRTLKKNKEKERWPWLGCTRDSKPKCIPCNKVLSNLELGTLEMHAKGLKHHSHWQQWEQLGFPNKNEMKICAPSEAPAAKELLSLFFSFPNRLRNPLAVDSSSKSTPAPKASSQTILHARGLSVRPSGEVHPQPRGRVWKYGRAFVENDFYPFLAFF